MVRRNAQDYALRYGARALGRLPEVLVRRLNGRPIVIDGNELSPVVQIALRAMNGSPGAKFEELPLHEARAHIDLEAWTFATSARLARIDDFDVPTRDGHVSARLYSDRTDAATRGILVYFHGGGWVLGGLDSADSVCRTLARATGLTVISIDYRLAPEHPFPAAVNDCIDAFRWVRDHATDFASLPELVGVGGESAGGNLAAVTSVVARDDEEGAPAFQVLFCPVTDLSRRSSRSYELFADGFFLTAAQMHWYAAHYLSGGGRPEDPLVSPLLAPDVGGLAPAYVAVAGFDVLRDEGIAYAERLRTAGVAAELVVHTDQIHGFFNACGATRDARDAVTAAGRWIVDILRAAPVRQGSA